MVEMNRRTAIGYFVRGVAMSLLGVIPGTFFNARRVLAADTTQKRVGPTPPRPETFEGVLQKTNKSNVYDVLSSSKLSGEDKLAILSVRELDRRELQTSLAQLDKGGPSAAAGSVCGGGCGDSMGRICGLSCNPISGAIGVIDRAGRSRINIGAMNKAKFRSSANNALQLAK
jgi:hypothetical protein